MKVLNGFSLVSLVLFTAIGVNAQSTSDTTKNKKSTTDQVHEPAPQQEVFTFVEQMPEFPGGNAAMQQFLQDHIQYPEQAKKEGAQGRVYVSIVIDQAGNLTQPTIVKDPGYGLGAEALRVLKSMPKWKPGLQNGKAVPVKMTIPITFSLQ